MHRPSPTYLPLDVAKPVADDVWIVDGPLIRFGMPWPKLSFPTRMTLIRLGRALFVHSPVAIGPALRASVLALGRPAWIVGPNRIHYWWIPDWHAAFPDAQVFLAPRLREQAGPRIAFDARPLGAETGYPWDAEIATLPVPGRFMTEMVFFHRPSRTLVLTDLIENFEADRLSLPLRWLTRAAGVQDPDGSMPRDMRATYPREALRRAVARMVAWAPERVILAHGRWYASDGVAELKRAFRWL